MPRSLKLDPVPSKSLVPKAVNIGRGDPNSSARSQYSHALAQGSERAVNVLQNVIHRDGIHGKARREKRASTVFALVQRPFPPPTILNARSERSSCKMALCAAWHAGHSRMCSRLSGESSSGADV